MSQVNILETREALPYIVCLHIPVLDIELLKWINKLRICLLA